MSITILGLGPGGAELLTCRAWDLLVVADEVYLRTTRHPAVAGLPAHLALHSFDELYDRLDDFAEVYTTIAGRILELGRRPQGVLYAVPGHPLVGESSVAQILARAREEGLAVDLVDGLSFLEPCLCLLELDGLAGLQLADATDLAAAHHPPLDPDHPALIGQLYGRRLASEVKLSLMNGYPDDHPVTLIQAAGTPQGQRVTIPLYELDRGQSINHLTTLYVPALPHVSGLPAFQETIARLRAPGGCPWDQQQTHQSLRENLLEETYEVLSALDDDDPQKLCEELGDLLMQVGMQIQIAAEEGTFKSADVIGQIDAKLKRRHPHVFGDIKVEGTDEVLRNWAAIKAAERAAAGNGARSGLDGIPAILPALARAQSLGERVAREGLEWSALFPALPPSTGSPPPSDEPLDSAPFDPAHLLQPIAWLAASTEEELRSRLLGELLFTLGQIARRLGVDAESALREACDRFTRAYAELEQTARAQGVQLAALPPAEQAALWQAIQIHVRETKEHGG